VTSTNIDATIESSVSAVRALGFERHGLVVRSAAGEVLLKQADHSVDLERVRLMLREFDPS